jgi:hypothetical protein
MTAARGTSGAMLKVIQRPSGDQSGCSRPSVGGTTSRRWVPSLFMTFELGIVGDAGEGDAAAVRGEHRLAVEAAAGELALVGAVGAHDPDVGVEARLAPRKAGH